MATYPRSQVITPGDTVVLDVTFKTGYGTPIDLDSFPLLTLLQPNGAVAIGPTSAGVYRISTGRYAYDFTTELAASLGVWTDIWQGSISGTAVMRELQWVVFTSRIPEIVVDGYVTLGDDPGFDYSQTAIININMLLKLLRARLKSSGKHYSKDEFGNDVYVDCDIYSIDQLVTFLAMALSQFNETPHFTLFTFDDTPIIQNFAGILVQGATLMALSSQALIERGREFQITDNGIGFTPPTISEMLSTQWNTELTNWNERLKMIKLSMKPSPLGLGGYYGTVGAPQFRRLRTLRARQIY